MMGQAEGLRGTLRQEGEEREMSFDRVLTVLMNFNPVLLFNPILACYFELYGRWFKGVICNRQTDR